jgi:ABC-type phosphate/phosphonate transport system substrate-binding protein
MRTVIRRRTFGKVVSLFTAIAGVFLGTTNSGAAEAPATAASTAAGGAPLVMVVMDPLAKDLSCPCVKGYAQREYQQLADFLATKLGRKVEVVFTESLVTATQKSEGGKADIIIGKQSVVLHDAKKLNRTVRPAAALSDKNGLTTQTGLIVVPQGDAAQTVSDLKSHLLVFGPADCDEKNAAAVALFKKNGVAMPAKLETAAGCEEGALRILELPAGERGAAVISSYAKPLLEGCGTVPKGALRVVGETTPVPFIAAFTSGELPDELRQRIGAALLAVAVEPKLCLAMESKQGFVPAGTDAHSGDLKKN